MNIGIDGYEANIAQRVGIGQYAYQLLSEIYKLDDINQYTIFLPNNPLTDMPKPRTGWTYKIGRSGSFWTIRQLPGLIKSIKLDSFFSPTHYCPWFTNLPKFISIMDLSYLKYPKMFKIKDLIQLRYLTAYSIKHAQKVFTISEYSKKEIIEQYNYPKDNIIVTYPGVNKVYTKINKFLAQKPEIFNKYNISKRFILFVGTLQPRKNISRLIQAFKSIESDLQLVLIGKKGWLYESILAQINKENTNNKIIYIDYIEENELAYLYSQAICLVLPSLFEGFGMPVVEAMSMGCPVVVSNNSSLPEIAQNAGIYVNPLKTEDIGKGILKAVKLTPEERSKLINQNYKQAQKFTWENCAKKTIEVITADI